MASCLARSQFTGPPDQDSSFCSSANSGICPARSSGSRRPVAGVAAGPKPNGKLLMVFTVVATNERRRVFRASAGAPRCADGERRAAGSVRLMAWALWLAVPVAGTVLAALVDLAARAAAARAGHRRGDAARTATTSTPSAQTARSKDRGPLDPAGPD